MSSALLKIQIMSPDQSMASVDAQSIVCPGEFGYFGVLPQHASMITELGIGVLSVDQKTHYFVSGGYVHVHNNFVKVLADVLEEASDIEIERAKAAQQRALDRMQKKTLEDQQQSLDWERANRALKRARTRVDFAVKSGLN